MFSSRRDLTDAQWEILDCLIPEPPRRKDGRGRPWRGRREVLDGILFILRTRAPWADLPERYPPYQTCHRRFQQWVRSGVMRGVLESLAEDLRSRGGFDLDEAFIDGSFAPAKNEAPALGMLDLACTLIPAPPVMRWVLVAFAHGRFGFELTHHIDYQFLGIGEAFGNQLYVHGGLAGLAGALAIDSVLSYQHQGIS